jgi:hypothetical protein
MQAVPSKWGSFFYVRHLFFINFFMDELTTKSYATFSYLYRHSTDSE